MACWVTSDRDGTIRTWDSEEEADAYLDVRDGVVQRRPGQSRSSAAFLLEAAEIMARHRAERKP